MHRLSLHGVSALPLIINTEEQEVAQNNAPGFFMCIVFNGDVGVYWCEEVRGRLKTSAVDGLKALEAGGRRTR